MRLCRPFTSSGFWAFALSASAWCLQELGNLTTEITTLAFHPTNQLICMASKWKKDAFRIVRDNFPHSRPSVPFFCLRLAFRTVCETHCHNQSEAYSVAAAVGNHRVSRCSTLARSDRPESLEATHWIGATGSVGFFLQALLVIFLAMRCESPAGRDRREKLQYTDWTGDGGRVLPPQW